MFTSFKANQGRRFRGLGRDPVHLDRAPLGAVLAQTSLTSSPRRGSSLSVYTLDKVTSHVLWTQLEGGGATRIHENSHSVQRSNKNTLFKTPQSSLLVYYLFVYCLCVWPRVAAQLSAFDHLMWDLYDHHDSMSDVVWRGGKGGRCV